VLRAKVDKMFMQIVQQIVLLILNSVLVTFVTYPVLIRSSRDRRASKKCRDAGKSWSVENLTRPCIISVHKKKVGLHNCLKKRIV